MAQGPRTDSALPEDEDLSSSPSTGTRWLIYLHITASVGETDTSGLFRHLDSHVQT